MKRWVWMICLLSLWGCRPAAEPYLDMPCQYAEGKPAERCGREPVDLSLWWEQFHDPFLTTLIEKATVGNFDLRIAKERVCEARGLYQIEFGNLLPFVEAIGILSRTRNSQTLADSPFLGAKFVDFYDIGFDMTWEIDLFGKIADGKRAAGYEMEAAVYDVFDAMVTVAADVSRDYVFLRSLQAEREVAIKHLKNDEELLTLTCSRYHAGLSSEEEPLRAKALVQERKALIPEIEIAIKQTIYRLGVLLGKPPEELLCFLCPEQPIPCAEGKIPLGLPSQLLRQRPDIRHAEAELKASKARLCVAKKDLLPSINFLGSYTWETGRFRDLFKAPSRNWFFIPSFSIPLFDAGQIRGNIITETARQRQAVIAYEKAVYTALAEVEGSLTGYFDESRRYYALEEEVAVNSAGRALALDRYIAGIDSFDIVIDLDRDLFDSENRLIESQENLMISLVSLYKSLGGGWPCSFTP